MFTKYKFNKKFKILTPYINNKELMNKFLENTNFNNYYNNNKEKFDKFIINLSKIYSNDKISTFLKNLIINFRETNIKRVIENIAYIIFYINKYDKDNYSLVNEILIEDIEKYYSSDIQKLCLNLCFKHYYKKQLLVRNIDFIYIFNGIKDVNYKEKLYYITKNNNLDLLVYILNEIEINNVELQSMDILFKKEISDKIYEPKTKEILGEDNYNKLIRYLFNKNISISSKKVISNILDNDNYELIQDVLHLEYYQSITKIEDYKMSFIDLPDDFKRTILYNYLELKNHLNISLLKNLRFSINSEVYDSFYNKHKEIIDLISKLYYDNFSKLSKDEQNKLYIFIKNLDDNKKKSLSDEILEVNKEMINLYKNTYIEPIKRTKNIIKKAKPIPIKDIALKEYRLAEEDRDDYEIIYDTHIKLEKEKEKTSILYKKHGINELDEVLVYKLENDEPFEILLTAMNRRAREIGLNMYGRPSHRITIDNPENYCKDLQNGSQIISTTMINDRYIKTFLDNQADVMYIYTDVIEDDILNISPIDAGLPPKILDENELFLNMEPCNKDDFMRNTINKGSYNEISIKRTKQNGERQIPSAILCFDEINRDSIIHAKYFNIPIIVIDTKTYKYINNQFEDKTKRL